MSLTTQPEKPLLSPFRYPGGKSWLRPIVRKWLANPAERLVEPFAGGGNITLTAVSEKLVKRATMVELDRRVAAVWQATLDGQSEWLATRIESFSPTKSKILKEVNRAPSSLRQLAWVTLLRNRVSYGGLMSQGAGLLNEGEAGNGITSRWYPKTLAHRIRRINKLKRRITFARGDGIWWLEQYRNRWNSNTVAYFIDPPYMIAGERLYAKSQLDHRQIFKVASKLKGRVLMTYENTPEIRSLASEFGFAIRGIRMLSREHQTKTELLISKDFSWLRNKKRSEQSRQQN